MLVYLSFAVFFVSVLAKNEEYIGYKVYNVKLTNEMQQDELFKLKSDLIDFWKTPCYKYNVIGKAMVPPFKADWFEDRLSEIGVEKDVYIDDVYAYLILKEQGSANNVQNKDDKENYNENIEESEDSEDSEENEDSEDSEENKDSEDSEENEDSEDSEENEDSEDSEENEDSEDSSDNGDSEDKDIVFDFDSYYRYDVILDHLYTLQELYANSATTVELVLYGQTEENRPLVYLKLTHGDETDKPVAVIEAAINPRDWVTVPSALNVVNRLLEDENRSYLDDAVWIVVPVLNPDGYEYTHTNLRLWTKSRSLRSHLGFICPGVHLDRNFDIDWLISDSSSSPCSHLYAGTDPTSEIETQMIKNIIEEYSPRLYISLQNSGKFVTFPWKYEKAASGLFRRHYLKGLEIVNVLDGYTFDSGAIAKGDRESGTSVDFARFNKVFYTFNIGVGGEGDDGVIVPEEDIKRIAEDVWKAVAVAAKGLELN